MSVSLSRWVWTDHEARRLQQTLPLPDALWPRELLHLLLPNVFILKRIVLSHWVIMKIMQIYMQNVYKSAWHTVALNKCHVLSLPEVGSYSNGPFTLFHEEGLLRFPARAGQGCDEIRRRRMLRPPALGHCSALLWSEAPAMGLLTPIPDCTPFQTVLLMFNQRPEYKARSPPNEVRVSTKWGYIFLSLHSGKLNFKHGKTFWGFLMTTGFPHNDRSFLYRSIATLTLKVEENWKVRKWEEL